MIGQLIVYGCIITNIISFNRFLNRDCTMEDMMEGREKIFERQREHQEFCRRVTYDCGLSPIGITAVVTWQGYPVMFTCPRGRDERKRQEICLTTDFHANLTVPVTNYKLNITGCDIRGGRISKDQCLLINRFTELKTSGVPFIY